MTEETSMRPIPERWKTKYHRLLTPTTPASWHDLSRLDAILALEELGAAEAALSEAQQDVVAMGRENRTRSEEVRLVQQQVTQQAATISQLQDEVTMYRHLNPNTRKRG